MSFHKNVDKPCVYKKTSGSAAVFLVLYVDDILLNGNDVSFVKLVNIMVFEKFDSISPKTPTFPLYKNSSKLILIKEKRLLEL